METPIYYIFGSKDSQDLDILCLVSQLGTIKTNKKRVEFLEDQLRKKYTEKELNINLAILRKGHIVEVFKGTPDEVNNSVLATYSFHEQEHPLLIEGEVVRDVDLKIVRVLRILLSFISRTKYRSEVKKALKEEVNNQVELLREIDFREFKNQEDLNKDSILLEDYYKNMAFQLGQVLALIEGVEVYSKNEVGLRYPELSSLLMREEGEGFSETLEKYKILFLDSFDVKKIKYKREPRRK